MQMYMYCMSRRNHLINQRFASVLLFCCVPSKSHVKVPRMMPLSETGHAHAPGHVIRSIWIIAMFK